MAPGRAVSCLCETASGGCWLLRVVPLLAFAWLRSSVPSNSFAMNMNGSGLLLTLRQSPHLATLMLNIFVVLCLTYCLHFTWRYFGLLLLSFWYIRLLLVIFIAFFCTCLISCLCFVQSLNMWILLLSRLSEPKLRLRLIRLSLRLMFGIKKRAREKM